MEERSSNLKNLDPLPASDDKSFWEHADVNANLVPLKVPFYDQPHHFVRKSGLSAQCTHCDWGFDLDIGDKIVDGHLYSPEGKLVL